MTCVVIRLIPLVLVATLVLACGARTGSPPTVPQGQQAATDPSELMWRELVEAARPEGKLVLATNNTQMRETVVPEFKKRFGIDVEILTGRGSDTVARIMRERGAGISTVDVLISGMGTVASELYPAKGIASIKSMLVIPEVTDSSKWRDNRIRFQDPDGEYILRANESIQNNIVINTDFVSRAELRRSDDLLNPKFQGKISTMDPLAQGGGDGVAGYFLKMRGEDFLRRLYVDQKPVTSRDDRQLTDWVARGVYPITLTMTEEDILELMREGIKVEAFSFDDIPPQIGAGGGFLSVMDPAPHPNATKLWVNWYASKEGQELVALALGQPSNRVDVEANKKLPSFLIPEPGREYFDLNDWNFVTVEERPLRARMRSLLGG
jgi:iron(III) transport system substrate-binding protein